MARLAAWRRKHTITVMKQLPPFFWMKGYFFHPVKGPNSETTLHQNLQEVCNREYFLKALGPIAGQRLLDIGCATGDYMAVIAELGGIVSGIDIDANAIAEGQQWHAKAGLKTEFHLGDASLMPFADETFDTVYSADVFEHITMPVKQAVVKEIYRVLKPGGVVVIKTPNLNYLRLTLWLHRFMKLLKGKSMRIYIEHTRNNPDNEHLGLTTYRELNRLFAEYLFLEPVVIHLPFIRGRLFISSQWRFPGRLFFNEAITVAYSKSVFLPVAERLVARVEKL